MISPQARVWAWYSLSFASAAPGFAAAALFFPLVLERLARSIGYWSPGLVVPCSEPMPEDSDGACQARIFGQRIETASFSLMVKSASVLVAVIFIITIGPLADDPKLRKVFLVGIINVASFIIMGFLLLPLIPPSWAILFAAAISIITTTSYQVADIATNAYLPSMALAAIGGSRTIGRDDESVIPSGRLPSMERQPLLSAQPTDEKVNFAIARLSSIGQVFGCVAALMALLGARAYLAASPDDVRHLMIVCGLSGTWWAVFALPASFYLSSGERKMSTNLLSGWKRLGVLLAPSKVRKLSNLFKFLIIWLLLSEALSAVFLTTVLYASSRLGMSSSEVSGIVLIPLFLAAFFGTLMPPFQRYTGFESTTILLGAAMGCWLYTVWASLGLFDLPFGGLKTKKELYIAFAYFGAFHDPIQGYARAIYTRMLPPGHESSFFSIFALTDKSGAFLGPLILSAVLQTTGNFYYAFLSISILTGLGMILFLTVDFEESRRQAEGYEAE